MKGWLHVIAASCGLLVAALIVFLVFGQASKQGEISGEAPDSQGLTNDRCGTVKPGSALVAGIITQARGSLPTIQKDGRPVTPTETDQVNWFARLHAASGLCIDEVDIRKEVLVQVTYPEEMSDADVAAHTYAALARSFEQPLVRLRTRVTVLHGNDPRNATVGLRAWQNFQRAHEALGLPATMAGLQQFRGKVGYSPQQLALTGWA